jgi:hypothetical protein
VGLIPVLLNSLAASRPKRQRRRRAREGLLDKAVLTLKTVNNSKDRLQGQPVARQLHGYVIILKEEPANISLDLLPQLTLGLMLSAQVL